jgi:hypothetical protein
MKLPLTLTVVTSRHVAVYDADGDYLFPIDGADAIDIGRAVINAVNEQPALKEKIARLEELIKKWR